MAREVPPPLFSRVFFLSLDTTHTHRGLHRSLMGLSKHNVASRGRLPSDRIVWWADVHPPCMRPKPGRLLCNCTKHCA